MVVGSNPAEDTLMPVISKRKLKSFLHAEALAREFRHQVALNFRNEQAMFSHLEKWMRVTGKIKYDRPAPKAPKIK
jgi:hypothetical protein